VAQPGHVREIGGFADAAVVGSAIVQQIATATEQGTDPAEAVEGFVRWLKGQ
jgi:tryptophan synthase alpha subunit